MGPDIIVIIISALILAGAIYYIVKQKKSGAKCIGCPHSKCCNKNNSCNSTCKCGEKK